MAAFCFCRLEALVLFSIGCSTSPGELKCERGRPFACAFAHFICDDYLLSTSHKM